MRSVYTTQMLRRPPGGRRLWGSLLPLVALFVACIKPTYITLPVRIGGEEVSPVARLLVENRTGQPITVLKRELCAAQEFISEEDPLRVAADEVGILALQAKRHTITTQTPGSTSATTERTYFVVPHEYVAWPPADKASPYAVVLFENPAGLPWEVRIDLEKAGLFAAWQQQGTPFRPAYKLVVTDLRIQGAPGAAPQPVERWREPLPCDDVDALRLEIPGCGGR